MYSGDSKEEHLKLGVSQKTSIPLVANEMMIICSTVEDRVLL